MQRPCHPSHLSNTHVLLIVMGWFAAWMCDGRRGGIDHMGEEWAAIDGLHSASISKPLVRLPKQGNSIMPSSVTRNRSPYAYLILPDPPYPAYIPPI